MDSLKINIDNYGHLNKYEQQSYPLTGNTCISPTAGYV